MKKLLINTLFAILSFGCFGQMNYEKGYFIDNQDQKIDCYIKDNGWITTPMFFMYKLTENEDVRKGNVIDVKEFCLLNSSRFIRADVAIDTSSSLVGNISANMQPLWKQTVLFLEVLVEGTANLYYYSGDYERYFYSCKNTLIKQLIYKEYIYENDQIAYNKGFQQQLYRDVCCSPFTANSIQNVKYSKYDLKRYFQSYNSCINPSAQIKDENHKKANFNIGLSSGLAFSSLSVSNNFTSYADAKFNIEALPLIAFNAEYFLPFHKNKWSLVLSPAYQSYNTELENEFGEVSTRFSSIEFAFGIKHYFYLNEGTKIYINGYYNPIGSFFADSKLGWRPKGDLNFSYLKIENYSANFILGVGFEYKRLFADMKYFTTQNILSSYPSWNSNLEKVYVSIGYKFFNTKK